MLTVTVFNRHLHRQQSFSYSPVQLGAVETGDEGLRLPAEDAVPANCRIHWNAGSGQVRLENRGQPVRLGDGTAVKTGEQMELVLPAQLEWGEMRISLREEPASTDIDRALVALDPEETTSENGPLVPGVAHPPSMETLSAWFRCLTELQQSPATGGELFRNAAAAAHQPAGLDGGILLVRCDKGWKIASSFVPDPAGGFHFRNELVERVAAEKLTLYHDARQIVDATTSRTEPSVVVAPIQDENGEVSGVVYGWRSHQAANQRRGIRLLEAWFVRLVAQNVGATLTRVRKETEIARKNALLSQAFPPRVVRQLQEDPAIFEGREKTVTTMYADLRGFSAISNRLAPKITYRMIVELMDVWTELVIANSGAVVDYFGDGLVAFWNAPLEIENHATLAVACAENIRESLPEFNEIWSGLIGSPLDAGIGITTGLAQVGNCGSRHRFKYGPHGTSVNLAARIEKLTRRIGCPILISQETALHIRNDYLVRRLGKAVVAGFAEPVDLYEPLSAEAHHSLELIHRYENALDFFEAGRLAAADRILADLSEQYPADLPARKLWRAIHEQMQGGGVNHPGLLPGGEDDRT